MEEGVVSMEELGSMATAALHKDREWLERWLLMPATREIASFPVDSLEHGCQCSGGAS